MRICDQHSCRTESMGVYSYANHVWTTGNLFSRCWTDHSSAVFPPGKHYHLSIRVFLKIAYTYGKLQRGTATGFFLAGTVLGPPLGMYQSCHRLLAFQPNAYNTNYSPTGPLFAGIILTLRDWRAILWVQTIMIGLGFCLSVAFIPSGDRKERAYKHIHSKGGILKIMSCFNSIEVFKVMAYPNVILPVSARWLALVNETLTIVNYRI